MLVHNDDPYLQVGPFEFEIMYRDPYRSIIHNFLTPSNIAKFDEVIRPKLTYGQKKPLVSGQVVSSDLEDIYDAPTIFFGDLHAVNDDHEKGSKNMTPPSREPEYDIYHSYGLAKIISYKIRIATHLQGSNDSATVTYRASLYGLGSMT